MRRRVLNFQEALYDNYWSRRIATRAPPPPPPLPGMEDVGVVTAPTASPAPPAPAAHPDMEKLCKIDKPSRNRQGQLKYWYFSAVGHGCKECVKLLVQDMGVDKNVTSDNHGYSAMDFAAFYEQPEMRAYLATL